MDRISDFGSEGWGFESSLGHLISLQNFLPKALSEKEIEIGLKQIIDQINAEGMKDMGKVMGIATKNMLGKADGKIISTVVRKLLS